MIMEINKDNCWICGDCPHFQEEDESSYWGYCPILKKKVMFDNKECEI